MKGKLKSLYEFGQPRMAPCEFRVPELAFQPPTRAADSRICQIPWILGLFVLGHLQDLKFNMEQGSNWSRRRKGTVGLKDKGK